LMWIYQMIESMIRKSSFFWFKPTIFAGCK
jgi:hypothetical protein